MNDQQCDRDCPPALRDYGGIYDDGEHLYAEGDMIRCGHNTLRRIHRGQWRRVSPCRALILRQETAGALRLTAEDARNLAVAQAARAAREDPADPGWGTWTYGDLGPDTVTPQDSKEQALEVVAWMGSRLVHWDGRNWAEPE